jgi:subtilisin family serine protease
MKKQPLILCVAVLCVVALTLLRVQGQVAPDTPGKLHRSAQSIPNSYIVVFNDNVEGRRVAREAEKLARAFGGTVGFTYEYALRGFSVELNEGQAIALSHNPLVAYVEENSMVYGAETQTAAPWSLDRIDQRALPLNNAYTYAGSGAGVNVYVIDGGIRLTHQEFKNPDGTSRAAFAFDNVGDGRNGNDCNGHGTHVAGIIGGNTYGVAKGAKLWSVRVLNCSNQAPAAQVLAGIDWVTGHHVKPAIANLSFASGIASPSMDDAVRKSIAAGVTYVVAAGNGGFDAGTRSPAHVTEAITVGASDSADALATFSNTGSVIDLFAPGVNIVSANSAADDSTLTRSGTSSAAPFVAGVAARYLSTHAGDAPGAVAEALKSGATAGKVTSVPAGTTDRLLYAAVTVSDDFNDNARDTAKWGTPGASVVTIAEQNRHLEITPPADTTGYDGYFAATTADLTDARVSVEVVQSTQQYYGIETGFRLYDPTNGNYVLFATGGGNYLFQEQTNGVMSRIYIPYDPAQHRVWRFRHSRANDTIYWESSADGSNWVVQRQMARAFSITDLQVGLYAGKYTATTPTSTAIFDNLWHEQNPISTLAASDDFNDNSLDAAQWGVNDPASPTVVSEQNQRLEVALQPNTAGYNGVTSTTAFDFRNKTVQVEVPQPTSQGGWVETYFEVVLDSGNYYLMDTGAGSFVFDAYTNGVRDRTLGTYSTAMRFWRFRQDAGAGTVSFETSPDGVAWNTFKTVNTTFALSGVKAVLGAGAWGTGNGAPGTALFDNFRVERNQALFPQSDNFNDNTQDTTRWGASVPAGMTVVEQNQRVELTPPADTTGYGSYYTINTADLTDARAAVEVVQSTQQYYGIETYFELSDPATGNYLLFATGGGNFVLQDMTNGVANRVVLAYDPAQMRFWRFRHNRANDTIVWETSADNRTWVARRTSARPFSITSLQTLFVAGKYTATTPTSTAVFDNLKLERND